MSTPIESVLVVEDDAALREALIHTLHAAGIAALAAGDAEEALQKMQTEDIALVISDVHMPGPNGYELLTSIKQLRPDLPQLRLPVPDHRLAVRALPCRVAPAPAIPIPCIADADSLSSTPAYARSSASK